MRIDIVTIFPDYLAPLDLSLVGKARSSGVLDVRVHDLRGWAGDRHRSVDDTPYGGGAGMVMRPDVWGAALDDVVAADEVAAADVATAGAAGEAAPDVDPGGGAPVDTTPPGTTSAGRRAPRLVVPTPSGRRFDQALAAELAAEPWLVFACGRYEGIDARVVADTERHLPVTELSIGDYVLNGGEAAALVVVEAVVRLMPGVVGNPHSLVEESHGADGLLEYPVYTKPPTWRGHDVPDVLLSGHHARIARWRRDEALRRTATRRPDLLERLDPATLDAHDRAVLAELGFPPAAPPVAE